MVAAIIDSHPVFLNGLTELLQHHYKDVSILRAGNITAFEENRGDARPDLILLGVNKVFDSTELAVFEQIKKSLPYTATVILYDEINLVLPFLTTGANGFLGKLSKPEELIECIASVTSGANFLDPQIFDLIFTTPRPLNP